MIRVTAITGGIGVGKSVVSHVLRAMGYPVYDSDTRARELMDSDVEIHARLCRDIHPEAVVEGVVRRDIISSVVFADDAALARLNGIVHAKLVADFRSWIAAKSCHRVFIETAILHQCPALHPHIDDVWEVTAPEQLRVSRVMRRSGLSEAEVRARIEAQSVGSLPDIPVHLIHNTPSSPLLPQIHGLLL